MERYENIYDAYYQPNLSGLLVPVQAPNMLATPTLTFTGQSAEDLYATRFVVPFAGTLKDICVFIGADSTGNGTFAVYDTDAARTLLAEGASTDLSAESSWINLGDTTLTVSAGQHIDIGVVFDNAATTFATVTAGHANLSTLPFDLPDVAADPVLSWKVASQATIGATQASVTGVAEVPCIIALVEPLS